MGSNEQGVVSEADAGTRLDAWLVAHTSIASRARARKALASGKVSVDGETSALASGGTPVQAGSIVRIAWSRPGTAAPHAASRARLTRAGVEVLYADTAIVVVNKPAGLLTDTATRAQFRTRDSLCKQLRERLGHRVWPAHRIDRDTTGVVAFARTEAIQALLRAQWAARTPERVYLCLVEGHVNGQAGRWEDWMAWDADKRIQRLSKAGAPHAALAQADWVVVKRGRHATALEVRLISGRRNQIRVHAMLRSHPLLGEVQYRESPGKRRAPRQALHASRLSFDHPETKKRVTYEAPLPDDLLKLLAAL